jgi:hypothetical protein
MSGLFHAMVLVVFGREIRLPISICNIVQQRPSTAQCCGLLTANSVF